MALPLIVANPGSEKKQVKDDMHLRAEIAEVGGGKRGLSLGSQIQAWEQVMCHQSWQAEASHLPPGVQVYISQAQPPPIQAP
jgi:hypothetical protein